MNVWHFHSTAVDVLDDVGEINTQIEQFYSDIATVYSANTWTGDIHIKHYDLLDALPRVPFAEDTETITGLGDADALPTECAITMSFQGVPISGVNQRRRRGRLFLGPIDQGASTTAAGLVTITTIACETIATAAISMIGAGSLSTWQWVVFSPTLAGTMPWNLGILEAAIADVENGWVDNAFDTQRRRGTAPTARTTFP